MNFQATRTSSADTTEGLQPPPRDEEVLHPSPPLPFPLVLSNKDLHPSPHHHLSNNGDLQPLPHPPLDSSNKDLQPPTTTFTRLEHHSFLLPSLVSNDEDLHPPALVSSFKQ
jgi:hypothetical protein